jgi:hypothetical protein
MNNFSSIKEMATELLDLAKHSTSIEECQTYIRQLKEILRDLSETQHFVGFCFKDAKSIVGNQRKREPKPKPMEGDLKTINGNKEIYLDGHWQPYSND